MGNAVDLHVAITGGTGARRQGGASASDAGARCNAVCTHIVEAQCPHDKSLSECIAACENVEAGVPETCRPLWDAHQSCQLDADYDCKDAGQPNTVCTTELEALNACYEG